MFFEVGLHRGPHDAHHGLAGQVPRMDGHGVVLAPHVPQQALFRDAFGDHAILDSFPVHPCWFNSCELLSRNFAKCAADYLSGESGGLLVSILKTSRRSHPSPSA